MDFNPDLNHTKVWVVPAVNPTNCLMLCWVCLVFPSLCPLLASRHALHKRLCGALSLSIGVKHPTNLKLFDSKIFQAMSWKVLSDQAFVCIIIVSIGSKKPLSLVFLASRPLCYRPILNESFIGESICRTFEPDWIKFLRHGSAGWLLLRWMVMSLGSWSGFIILHVFQTCLKTLNYLWQSHSN